MPQDTEFEFRALAEGANGPFAFSGFPYLITRISAGFHHMILLPQLAREALVDWGVRQQRANRLPTCVAMAWDDSAFINGNGASDAACVPWASYTLTGLIETFPLPEDDAELATRQTVLSVLMDGESSYPPRITGYVVAERTDILREASGRELVALRGQRKDGAPKGLVRCSKCRRHRGECLDRTPGYEGLVARVNCRCENDTRCSRCGSAFGAERLNSGSYNLEDGNVWQVPAFAALSHQCEPPSGNASLEGNRSHRP